MPDPVKSTLDELRIDRDSPGPESSPRWIRWTLLALLLLALASASWFFWPRTVTVQTASARTVTAPGAQRTVLNASGYVTARRQATVSSKVTGKVVEVLIEEGMKVEQGQVMARLDVSNVEATLRLNEAELEAARTALGETKALLEQAERELKRITSLADSRIASQSELDDAAAAAKSLRARLLRQEKEVVVAQEQVAIWRQELEDRVIRAPFSGVVITKDAQPGEMISPVSAGGGFTRTGIGTIVDMSSLEIEVDVNEAYLNRVQPDQPVTATLDSYPQWQIPCKVIAIVPTADRQKATVKVRIAFDQLDPRILPDMGVKVAFKEGEESPTEPSSLAIPAAAVRRQNGDDVVLVVRDQRLERRAVSLGATQQNEVLILAGLTEGERVVVAGPDNLADGMRVKEIQP